MVSGVASANPGSEANGGGDPFGVSPGDGKVVGGQLANPAIRTAGYEDLLARFVEVPCIEGAVTRGSQDHEDQAAAITVETGRHGRRPPAALNASTSGA